MAKMNERLEKVIQHPLHRHFGISEVASVDGKGRLSFAVSDAIINPAGVLHGGVVYAVCDVCAYVGLLSVLAEDREAVTHDIHVSVIHAAKRGETVTMESTVVKQGKRLCFIQVKAMASGTLIATATITKSII